MAAKTLEESTELTHVGKSTQWVVRSRKLAEKFREHLSGLEAYESSPAGPVPG